MISETMKQTLARLGYTTIRAHNSDGTFHGLRIYKDGECVHDAHVADREICIELIKTARGSATRQAPETVRPTLRDTAAVFEFVGRWDDYAGSDRLTLDEIRQAANQYGREERSSSCDNPARSTDHDPDEAIKYIRADSYSREDLPGVIYRLQRDLARLEGKL